MSLSEEKVTPYIQMIRSVEELYEFGISIKGRDDFFLSEEQCMELGGPFKALLNNQKRKRYIIETIIPVSPFIFAVLNKEVPSKEYLATIGMVPRHLSLLIRLGLVDKLFEIERPILHYEYEFDGGKSGNLILDVLDNPEPCDSSGYFIKNGKIHDKHDKVISRQSFRRSMYISTSVRFKGKYLP